MKIKLGDKVTWLGTKRTVKAIHPMPFAVLTLADENGNEWYLLKHDLEAFIKENENKK